MIYLNNGLNKTIEKQNKKVLKLTNKLKKFTSEDYVVDKVLKLKEYSEMNEPNFKLIESIFDLSMSLKDKSKPRLYQVYLLTVDKVTYEEDDDYQFISNQSFSINNLNFKLKMVINETNQETGKCQIGVFLVLQNLAVRNYTVT